jgi:hypothetical protein
MKDSTMDNIKNCDRYTNIPSYRSIGSIGHKPVHLIEYIYYFEISYTLYKFRDL